MYRMTEQEMINGAIIAATIAHGKQVDKAGQPYILHPLRLMMKFKNSGTRMIVAVLHDVIEDTETTLEELRHLGFTEEVIEAVDALSRRESETYNEYIDRVLQNEIAVDVKIADIIDNSDITRFADLPFEGCTNTLSVDTESVRRQSRRLEQYAQSMVKLMKHKRESGV